ETEILNGFINRFCIVCVRRAGVLSRPSDPKAIMIEELQATLADALAFAQEHPRLISLNDEAQKLWDEVYPSLSAGEPGIFGEVTNRAEVQVGRMALIYALADKHLRIGKAHLQAALAVWQYAKDSAFFLFGERTGNPIADQIAAEL